MIKRPLILDFGLEKRARKDIGRTVVEISLCCIFY